jgi:hypothetical protein
MNPLRFISIFFVLWLTAMPYASAAKKKSLPPPSQQIPLGERLIYKISWLRIPVGFGELEVKEKTVLNGHPVFYVVGGIETNKVLSKIFPIHDKAYSWIDAETFESLQFEKTIDELIIKTHEKMVFDRENKKGHFESFKTGEKKEFSIPVPVHDVLSAFFWARRQVLAPGKSAKVVLTADQKNWTLEVRGLRYEQIKLDGDKIETLRVEPTSVVDGVEKKGKAWFNITTDAKQVPVKIVYKTPAGKIVGTLMTDSPKEDTAETESD